MKYILGTAIARLETLLTGIVSGSYQKEWGSYEIMLALSTTIVFATWVLAQVLMIMRQKKKSWMGVVIRMASAVVVALVWLGLVTTAGVWSETVRAPRAVQVQRVNPVLVSVSWRSFDKELTVAMWGYSEVQIQEAAVGTLAGELTKEHEVLIPTEPSRAIYVEILAGGRLYPVAEGGI